MGLGENKRFALNIGVTLSTQLINACLSMLAVIGAVFIFILDKRETTFLFYLLIILGFISFIISIILGGKGIDKVRKKSFKGELSIECSKKHFNRQAITCLIGIISSLSSLFFTSKILPDNSALDSIKNSLEEIHIQNKELDSLKIELNSMKNEFNRIKTYKDTLPNNNSSQIEGNKKRNMELRTKIKDN